MGMITLKQMQTYIPTTSKMEDFVTIINGFQPLIMIRAVIDWVLDPTWIYFLTQTFTQK